VSLATYNEAGNVRDLISDIRAYAPRCSVLIIDDNSPDGTGRIAEGLRETLPDVHVIHRPGKLGLGSATIEAMRFAIAGRYDLHLNLDADFSHPPRYIPALLAGMRDHDVMIGSRYVPGGGVTGQFNWKRKLMSASLNSYSRLLLGLTTRDNSGAFRCYRVAKLAELDLARVQSRGYSFQEEILFRCREIGCRIGETPIVFEDRRSGTSKIDGREAREALRVIFRLGVSRALGQMRWLLGPGGPPGRPHTRSAEGRRSRVSGWYHPTRMTGRGLARLFGAAPGSCGAGLTAARISAVGVADGVTTDQMAVAGEVTVTLPEIEMAVAEDSTVMPEALAEEPIGST
jgi:dolichol-phosphate mannosyltransferase